MSKNIIKDEYNYLNEDEEFEEFEIENLEEMNGLDENNLWKDDWDYEGKNDFLENLKKELNIN